LLILLPFTFIEFFYAPWLKAQNQARAPRELPEDISGHVILTNLDAVTTALISKLKSYGIPYTILVSDLQKAIELTDQDFNVVLGDPDDPDTYRRLRIRSCSMIVTTANDMINTNITFTVRELFPDVRIVATANNPDSVDILKLAGASQVVQMGDMLGKSLARRTLGGNARVHVIGHIDTLVIGEATAMDTPLIGKTLSESGLREKVGINVVGIWERGKFILPQPDSIITEKTVLVLAGTVDQLRKYDELLSIYHVSDKPVVIIGAGRVGRAAAKSLEDRQIDYRIIDKDPAREKLVKKDKFILGDAADLDILEVAGLREAHSILITTHDDDVNIYLTIYCRQLRPNLQIISRTTFDKNVSTMHRAGADFVMSYATMGSSAILNILENHDILMVAEGLNVFNKKVSRSLVGKDLIESGIRQKTGCSVIAVRRDDELQVNPDPTIRLQKTDELIMIGLVENEEMFGEVFGID
jgi:Trk K+ transport system NAD-binding subunit